MKPAIPLLLSILPAAGLLSAAAPAAVRGKTPIATRATATAHPTPAPDEYRSRVLPLMRKYCGACHGLENPPSGLSLLRYADTAAVVKARDLWERVARALEAQHMPPAGAPKPSPAERELLVSWIDSTLSSAECRLEDPGRVTMRRLNRTEYNNTIRDLFGIRLRPADAFPSDDVGYGFDNIGDVLTISPLLMEKYLAAAEQVARAAILAPEDGGKRERYREERLAAAGGEPYGTARILTTVGELAVEHTFPQDGEYLVRVRAFGQQAGPDLPRMAVRIDGKEVAALDVGAVENAPEVYQTRAHVRAGKRRVAVAFLNDFQEEPTGQFPRARDRNLIVDTVEIQGPLGLPKLLPLSHRRIFLCRPTEATRAECARKILGNLARRAFRRPVTKAELDRLVRIAELAAKEGESFERGIQLATQAILVSPHFLFRVEIDPRPGDGKRKRPVGQYEMASRLSYFLWSSMPDEELFRLAARGRLQDPKVLAAQVKRMLRDPRSRSLAENFGSQWLTLRRLGEVSPDPKRFPEFNDGLRRAMQLETELFIADVIREDRSILEFLDGRFTYVNDLLARHYGMRNVRGSGFRRVALTGEERMGILTHASVLTVTSNPTRTSPVARGKWVLEQLMGTPPPPPPPDVPELADDRQEPLKGTLRQRMEQHRENPSCASCHARMDPIGFGLENFDAIGRWRTQDGGHPIDASGELPGGKRFNGPKELIAALKENRAQFVKNLTEKLLTYALGRGLEPYDNCNVGEIARKVERQGYRFSALATEIVLSEPFRMRRGDGGQKR